MWSRDDATRPPVTDVVSPLQGFLSSIKWEAIL